MHHDRSNRPAPRVGRPIRRATSFVAALAFTACTGVAAQTIDGRMTAGDFELTDSVNRFALQKDLDFAPFRSELDAMSSTRFAAIGAAVARKPIASALAGARALGVTTEELTVYFLKKIEANNAYYHAVMQLDPSALDQARAIDRNPDARSAIRGAVALVKGNIGVAGLRNDAGSAALGDIAAAVDSQAVARLKEAGVVVLGRANLSEFANFIIPPPGFNAQGGQTLSPFGPLTISPSSSSGGSAAALPLGYANFTLGTETMGSIIAPAAVEGVAALRPDSAAWGSEGVVPFDVPLDSVGAFAYAASDLTKINAAMTGAASAPKAARVVFMAGTDSPFALEARRLLQAAGIGVVEPDAAFLAAWNQAPASNPGRTCAFVEHMNRYLATAGHAVSNVSALAAWYHAHPRTGPYGTALIDQAAADTTGDMRCDQVHADAAVAYARVADELARLGASFVVYQDNGGSGVTLSGAARATLPIAADTRGAFQSLTLNAVQKGRTAQMLATLAALEAVRSFDPNAVPVVASAR